ncbi:S9 family peptidase [Afifella aestuarii]|uniref:S9 family peptidase n=1 Tax=Afifella aestuarii TaxID=1909496 RepID=UPI0013E29453|nr:alpha/beta fold hydrolase [Afifella aestuarii]
MLALSSFEGFYGSQFALDPSGRYLAFSVQTGAASAPRFGVPFLVGAERGKLHLLDLQLGDVRLVPSPQGLGLFSPVFSPDGARISLAVTDGRFVRPCVFDLDTQSIRVLTDRNLALRAHRPPTGWLNEREIGCELLPEGQTPLGIEAEFRGVNAAVAALQSAQAGQDVTASVLSDRMESPRSAEGELAQINASSSSLQSFPDAEKAPTSLQSFARRERVVYPPPVDKNGAQIVLADKQSGQEVLVERVNDATRVLIGGGAARRTVFETDRHLKEVCPGSIHSFVFETRSGHRAFANVIQPPVRREGDPNPGLVWLYPGADVPEGGGEQDRLNSFRFINLQLLAARGITVIRPSVPIENEAADKRPMVDQVCDAVLPAIEAAVQNGYVDPDQLHVGGHSLGGWAALALLAETDRFRSGIAISAASNLISLHGVCDPRDRYAEEPHFNSDLCERNWQLPGPPWRHLEAYVRNSPLFSVERIKAPLLLIHGDLDYCPIEQSETMFAALRDRKQRVEFVRYFGEGHVPSSPANIRDLIERMIRWLKIHSV